MKFRFTAAWHYPKEDTKCNGDYCTIVLFYGNKVAAPFGDYYHDKGAEKLEAFLRGVKWVTGEEPDVMTIKYNDVEY